MTLNAWPVLGRNRSYRVAVTAIMTALTLVGLYSLSGIPNVELGSVILFSTAYLFGIHIGVVCALLSSIIYGVFNPWGVFIPLIWFTQFIGWLFTVMVGGIVGKSGRSKNIRLQRRQFMMSGALTTLYFDLITNAGYAFTVGTAYHIVLLMGLPFMIVHMVTNTIFFPLLIPVLQLLINPLSIPVIGNSATSSE